MCVRKQDCFEIGADPIYLENYIGDERNEIKSFVFSTVKLGHHNQQVCPREHRAAKNLFVKTVFPSEYNLSPFCDLLVCPENWVFNVDGVISHASQDQGLIKSTHNKHCVVVLWEERGLVMNGKPRVSHQQHLILKKQLYLHHCRWLLFSWGIRDSRFLHKFAQCCSRSQVWTIKS